jgi:hypothetical protein
MTEQRDMAKIAGIECAVRLGLSTICNDILKTQIYYKIVFTD